MALKAASRAALRPGSDASLTRWKEFFEQWRSPSATDQALRVLSNRIGDHLIDHPRAGWARTAWVAARYARERAVEAVRICAVDPPDFEVRFWNGVIHRCEAVEVVRPGRRRGDELWHTRNRPWLYDVPVSFPETDWIDHDEALAAVDEQVMRKVAKDYAEQFVLVVYVNLGFVKNDRAFKRGLNARTEQGEPAFQSVFFLY